VQTRRAFLATGAAVLLSACGDSKRPPPPRPRERVDVAVIGGGLAGLVATYRLRTAGVDARLYEGSNRLGGRAWSLREQGYALGEHGGQFIDSTHSELLTLCSQLGLETVDRIVGPDREVRRLDGRRVTDRQLTDEFDAAWERIGPDLEALNGGAAWNVSSEETVALDRLTAAEWIDTRIEGGRTSALGQSLAISHTTLSGIDVEELSSLSILYALSTSSPGDLRATGDSDERYVVREGSGRVPEELVKRIGDGAIETRVPLVALRREGEGAVIVLEDGVRTRDITARRVVLALPFTKLREVDLGRAGLSEIGLRTIRELAMGTNAKLHLGPDPDPGWRRKGLSGDGQSTELQTVWDERRGVDDQVGQLVQYTGGKVGRTLFSDIRSVPHTEVSVGAVAPTYEAAEALFGRRSRDAATMGGYLDRWADDPWTHGSYSGYTAGQWTTIAGYAGTPEPPFHFAGEHTSVWQGYMNGAVESGERAAGEIIG
jgi:monoamine oxidase